MVDFTLQPSTAFLERAIVTAMECQFYIYVLRRPDKTDPFEPWNSQPFYVGKGCNGRYLEHRKEALGLLHKPGNKSIKVKIIHKLWKIGLDFQVELVMENLEEWEAFEIEKQAIMTYGRINNNTGTLANLTNGGEGIGGCIHTEESKRKFSESHKGNKPSEETRLKMSKSHKGNQGRKGQPLTEEIKAKISKSNTGRVMSEETKQKLREHRTGKPLSQEHRQKLSEARKGKYGGENHPRFGKTHTEESRQKMSLTRKGRKIPKEVIEKRKATVARKRQLRLSMDKIDG
jgi:hypothetical protein